MATRIKFDEVVPFPPRDGVFVRMVFNGNNISKGNILLMNGDEVLDLSTYGVCTPDVLLRGDQLAAEDGGLVTYSRVTGVSKIPKPADQPGPSQ